MGHQNEEKMSVFNPIQFVGCTYGRWMKSLPVSWIPYLQLTRLNIAAPLALVYFPHLLGILHTAASEKSHHHSPADVFYFAILLLGGSLFYANAAHAWDDLIDSPLDKMMDRTKNRPIPRGAISHHAALIFTTASGICAAAILLFLPSTTALTAVPSITLATYYPWAKRHSHFPQVILGFCLAWGIMVGKASMTHTSDSWPWEDSSAIWLVLAYAAATVIYDTIYAYQDVTDDLKLGLGSTAILFKGHIKLALSILTACMAISLYYCGTMAGMGRLYFLMAIGGAVMSVGSMVYNVRMDDPASCWLWFSSGFWTTMLSITTGLLLEYLY